MIRHVFDKSSIPLLVIIALLAVITIVLGFSLRSDAVDAAIKSDLILKLAVILEREGKPASTQLFLFYPVNGRGALLDLPSETGLIIKSLKRVDRLDALYERHRPQAYIAEMERLLDSEIPYWLILDEEGLADVTDLVSGLELFIPAAIDLPGPPRALLPSGALVLDGSKTAQFAFYKDPNENDADAVLRRQKLFQSFIRRLGEKAAWLVRPEVYPVFRRFISTNLSDASMRRLLPELSKLDTDRLVLQKVTGSYRNVDGKRLLFPHYDGELVRDIVKQTLNALANSESGSPADKIFTLELLNGTAVQGLAKRAAEIFEGFGYEVIAVGNADRDDYTRSALRDHYSNSAAAKNIAAVINCSNIVTQAVMPGSETADFTLILGADFNGRTCGK